MTINLDKGLRWLEEFKQYEYQLLEYVLIDDEISDHWERCWFYDKEGKLHQIIAKDYF